MTRPEKVKIAFLTISYPCWFTPVPTFPQFHIYQTGVFLILFVEYLTLHFPGLGIE